MTQSYREVKLLGKTVFEKATFKPPMHNADVMEGEACLIFAESGDVQVHGVSDSTGFRSGESLLMKCGNFVSKWRKNDTGTPSKAIIVHFYPDVIDHVFQGNSPSFLTPRRENKLVFSKIKDEIIIEHYFKGLDILLQSPEYFSKDMIAIKLREIISLLYSLDSNSIKDILANLFTPDESKFRQTVETHVFSNISVNDLAQLSNLSIATFNRKFKKAFGESPAVYFTRKKLEKASALLAGSEFRISEICLEVGYNDTGTFSKAFHRRFGKSPQNYRADRIDQD